MKFQKSTLCIIMILCSTLSFAQNTKYVSDKTYQKSLKFDQNTTVREAESRFMQLYDLDKKGHFKSIQENKDDKGTVHQRKQQFYQNLKVEFGTVITHINSKGFVSMINGELYNPKQLNLVPTLTAIEAFDLVLKNQKAKKYLWEDAEQANLVAYSKPKGELLIFPLVLQNEVRLAYKFDLYSIDPIAREEVYIDAHSGNILYKNPIIKHANTIKKIENEVTEINQMSNLILGTANTKYSGTRSIETTFNASLNKYVLADATRGNGIVTYNCERLAGTYQNVHFKDNDNNWTTAEHANTFWDNAALDAHWGAAMTYDFWKTIFNRNSFDNNNAQIKSYVHYRKSTINYNNAFWNGSFMTYGDGNAKPLTTIDVCGHEIGHAVCTHTANLAYQNQSGAINEGYSDIWGACIEHFGRTGSFTGTPVVAVWQVGEDLGGGGFRSMNNPLSKGDPDTFMGTNWVETADEGTCSPNSNNDHCGVHTNSGVLNRWFYILSAGGSGTNNAPIPDTYSVTGIGIQKAAKIAYFAERDYLTPNATYFDVREATLNVVNELYCATSTEAESVTNAWFSVNVGSSYVSYTTDLAVKKPTTTTTLSCSNTTFAITVPIENHGLNSINATTLAYNIDGGTNTNVSWTGNMAACTASSVPISINLSAVPYGAHVLNITGNLTGDLNVANNTIAIPFFKNTAVATNSINTFEAASDNLIAYNDGTSGVLWQRGTSSKTTLTNTIAGSQVYATSLTGAYPAETKSYLVSHCYDLSQMSNPILKFDMAFDLENEYDILYMEYSTNGTTWNLLGTVNDANWYNSNALCDNCVGGEWTGEANLANGSTTNGTKKEYSYNLNALAANTNIVFRFVFQSDPAVEEDGVIIDNFQITTSSLSNNTFDSKLFEVYPNPSNGIYNLKIPKFVGKINIQIVDINGRVILNQINEDFNNEKTINLSAFQSGVYVLKISGNDFNFSQKLIKN